MFTRSSDSLKLGDERSFLFVVILQILFTSVSPAKPFSSVVFTKLDNFIF